MEKKDLKIDLRDRPTIKYESGYKNIFINMYGMSEVEKGDIDFMANVFIKSPKAAKLIINASEKIKEQLKVFCLSHGARFIR